MKFGISADFHLRSRKEHPERFKAFEDILNQCKDNKIDALIIAGDLFDANLSNYSEFEAICKSQEYSGIQFFIIPGNHDPEISNQQIVANNVKIFAQPEWERLEDGWELLFVPYQSSQTMGTLISVSMNENRDGDWGLVGHGDWFETLDHPNDYEGSKVYMPLTRKEINKFNPKQVFLGHIHVPKDMINIHYAGSPCPLDITETGYRRFLTFDTKSGDVDQIRINNDTIYFIANLLVMPTADEQDLLQLQIDQIIQTWEIDNNDKDKVKIRVRAEGYSNDREAVVETIYKGFEDYQFYEDPDIAEVNISQDIERDYLVNQFQLELENLEYPVGGVGEPEKKDILLMAMEMIYKGKS